MRALLVGVICAAASAHAGTAVLGNDAFSGSGMVNSAVDFQEYEGAAVLISPDGGYPLKLVGVDVLMVTYNQGPSGELGAYQLDVWDESLGTVAPPKRFDGGYYPARDTEYVELTTSGTQFNRIMLTGPLMIPSGRIFISLGEQTSTSLDSTTVGLDEGGLVPGANWYREPAGAFTRIDLPDAGFYRGINHNWIMRAVIEVPDTAVSVVSIFPNAGLTSMPTAVTITGTNFDVGSTAYVGSTALTVTGMPTSTSLSAIVPAGLTPGLYSVKVQSSGGSSGVLNNAFQVLSPDGGTGAGGGAGGGGAGGGAAGGGAGGGSAAGGGASGGGGSSSALRLDAITPNEGSSDESTTVVLSGDGFASGAQVLVGSTLLNVVDVKSASVIDTVVGSGMTAGTYDVTVINLDGQRATLPMAFTVKAGVHTKSGCGCAASPGPLVAVLLALLAVRRRRVRVVAVAQGNSTST
jgi:MYXO-CTERM domain-containing protein